MFCLIIREVIYGPFLREVGDRIVDDDVLSKIDALIDWQWFSLILKRGLGGLG